jgi:hypothetical protein
LPFNKIARIKLRRRSHVVNVWHRIMDRRRGVSVRGGMKAPFARPSFSLGGAPLFSVEVEPLLGGFTLAKESSTLGVVFGPVGPKDFFPKYSSNIAFITNLIVACIVSKDAKCSSHEIEEEEIDGGVSLGGVSLPLSPSIVSLILLGG